MAYLRICVSSSTEEQLRPTPSDRHVHAGLGDAHYGFVPGGARCTFLGQHNYTRDDAFLPRKTRQSFPTTAPILSSDSLLLPAILLISFSHELTTMFLNYTTPQGTVDPCRFLFATQKRGNPCLRIGGSAAEISIRVGRGLLLPKTSD